MGLVLAYNKGNAQPNFTVGAAITGTAEVGQTLTCTYTVLRAKTVEVVWYCQDNDDAATPVNRQEVARGAATFVPTFDVAQKYILSEAVATNNAATVKSTSALVQIAGEWSPTVPPASISLSTTVLSDATSIGGTVATITSDGDAPVTFTVQADPDSKFDISGSSLLLEAVVDYDVATSHSVTIRATNSGGYVDETFTITVADAAGSFLTTPTLALDEGASAWNAGEYVVCEFEVSGGTPAVQWFYFTNLADIDGTKTNISTGAVAPKALLPVSSPNAYQAAYFLDTATFGGSNAYLRYIGCDVTIGSATERVTHTASAIGNIEGTPITQAMIDANDVNNGYWLMHATTSPVTYYLDGNVSFNRSGFMFCRDNTTLNLNGKTMTYGAQPQISVDNWSFEDGLTGWDLANAGSTNPTSHDPEDKDVAYARCEIAWGGKSVRFNNTTATGYIQSTGTFVVPAVYDWVLQVHGAYGYYGQTNPGVRFYVELRKASDDSLVSRASTTESVTSNMPTVATTVLLAEDTECYLRVGIEGHASATQPVHMDGVRVVCYQPWAFHVGQKNTVADGLKDWYRDVPAGTIQQANGSRIKNGTVVCPHQHWRAHGLAMRDPIYLASPGFTRVDLTVSGHSSHCIKEFESNNENTWKIQHNVFRTTGIDVRNRQAYDGVLVYGVKNCHIRYNDFYDGPMGGIHSSNWGNAGGYSKIYGNTFRLKDRASNAFAITGGRGAQVYDNLIYCGQGDYHCRGIAIASGLSAALPTRVYNNIIECQEVISRQEYGSLTPPGNFVGAYCMQIESEQGPIAGDIKVYSNTVRAYATVMRAWCLRMNPGEFSAVPNVEIYDNDFEVYATGGYGRGGCLRMYNVNEGVSIYNNRFYTEDTLVSFDQPSVITLTDCEFSVGTLVSGAQPAQDAAYNFPWEANRWYNGYDSSSNAAKALANVTDDDPNIGSKVYVCLLTHYATGVFNAATRDAYWQLINQQVNIVNPTYADAPTEAYFDNRTDPALIAVVVS